jgi:hypothetical protein
MEFGTQAIWLILDFVFNVLCLRNFWSNSSLRMRRIKTHPICFENRTSTIPRLGVYSRRDISERLIRVTRCEEGDPAFAL